MQKKLSNFSAYLLAGKLSIAFSAGNSIANTIQHRDRYFPESWAGQDQKKPLMNAVEFMQWPFMSDVKKLIFYNSHFHHIGAEAPFDWHRTSVDDNITWLNSACIF